MVWLPLVICTLLAAFFSLRMQASLKKERSEPDTGAAILDFGRAFPHEAIRAIHGTADGKAYFVRLHDGKAGFVLSHGKHFLCHLIEPGKVTVENAPSGRGLAMRFSGHDAFNGVYDFRTPDIAAEVSLWLLGAFTPLPVWTQAPAR